MRREKYSEHSEPVQEIIGSVPSWIIRWGITAFFAVFVLVIIAGCFIKYPQTIPSTISIISTNPPSQLKARYAGIIDTIAVANGQYVKQNDLIAILRTPAVFEDIQTVEQFVTMARESTLPGIIGNTIFDRTLELGDIQDKWTEMFCLYKEYMLCDDLDQIGKKRALMTEQIVKSIEYYDLMRSQRGLLEEDAKLQMSAMQRDSILWRDGSMTQAEYESSKQAYLSKLKSLISFEATVKSVELNVLMLKQGLNELDTQRQSEEDAFNLRFIRIAEELDSQIADWMEKYVIYAPFDGYVSLQDYWGKGQHINVGDVLANVVLSADSKVEGRMKVSSVGFGKVSIGQTVNVRLNGFPYVEYGILKGKVSKISQVPEKYSNGSVAYTVEVSFPNGLESTYHKNIPFIQDMDGEAEIITRNQRLIELFLEPIMSLYRNR